MLRSFEGTPFAGQEAKLRRLLGTLPLARLSIDRSGIGMNLAENLSRDFPQVVGENFTNESKERWATDFKILLQRRDVTLPRDRELVGQVHAIKRRVLPRGRSASTPSAMRVATPTSSGRWRSRAGRSARSTGHARARSACGCWGDLSYSSRSVHCVMGARSWAKRDLHSSQDCDASRSVMILRGT